MRKPLGIVAALFTLFLVTVSLFVPLQAKAADIRAGDHIFISENQTNLRDLYLFGSNVQVNAPTNNDLVASGGDIIINGSVANDLMVGGGNITINGKIGNTARIAGGNITIDGPITNDLIVAGGNITVSKNASIGGDVLFGGGTLHLEAPVHGKILMSGGNIILDNTVGSDVTAGNVGHLTLGPQARINGNLSYTSNKPLQQDPNSKIRGKIDFHHSEKQQQKKSQSVQAFASASLYKLLVDIILSILLIYFFRKGLLIIFNRMQETPFKSGGIGFAYVILAPLASLLFLILLWFGIGSFLAYFLLMLIGIFIAKIFLGWITLRWWDKRQKQVYQLDWKAGVIGPILLFIFLLIPILGWFVDAIIFFIAIGALIEELINLMPHNQGLARIRQKEVN